MFGWLKKAVETTIAAPSNLAKSVAHETAKIAPEIQRTFKSITTSPYWKVAAGAAILIPGAGVAISAGMAGLTVVGKAASAKDALLSAGREAIGSQLGPVGEAGFDAANGMLLQGKPVTEEALNFARKQLADAHPEALAGFDAATAMHVGRYALIKAPVTMTDPNARAAFYTAQGLRTAPPHVIKRVHTSLGVSKHPGLARGFKTGVKAAKKEAQHEKAQAALAYLRETMALVRRDDPHAVASVRATMARAKKGDTRASAELKMLAIADRANREIDGGLSGATAVQVGGFPVLAWLKGAAGYVSALATLPVNWIREAFYEDDENAAHAA